MADFSPPFADEGERRAPTTDEQNTGFACGPADIALFNWMFWSLQAEMNEVIEQAGLTPSNSDMTQLFQAIDALISSATGGADTSTYLLMTQARARQLVFPEVLNSNAHFGVTAPSTGTIRIPASVQFRHRGIFDITTSQTDFATDPSKTYHLRWNPTDGFALKDLANGTYNPSTLAENNAAFDSTYDDMLIARIVTNSSNVATITNLANKANLTLQTIITGTNTQASGLNAARHDFLNTFNWARRPTTFTFVPSAWSMSNSVVAPPDFSIGHQSASAPPSPSGYDVDRYRVSSTVMYDYTTALNMHFSARA